MRAPVTGTFLGFSAYRAWYLSLFAFAADIPVALGVSEFASPENVLFFAPCVVAAIVIAVFGPQSRLSSRSFDAVALPLACVLGVLGMACLATSLAGGAELFARVGLLLVGLCGGYCEVAWGARFATLPPPEVQGTTFLTVALASLAAVGLTLIPLVARLVLLFVLLGLSVGALRLQQQADRSQATGWDASGVRTDGTRALRAVLLAFAVFGVVFYFVRTLASFSVAPDVVARSQYWANAIVSAILLLCLFLLKPVNAAMLFRIVLPTTAVGFVMLLFSPDGAWGTAAMLVATIGSNFYDVVVWILVFKVVNVCGLSANRFSAFMTLAKYASGLVGLALATALLHTAGAGGVQMGIVVPVAICLLVACFAWVVPERAIGLFFGSAGERPPEGASESAGHFASPAVQGAEDPVVNVGACARAVAARHGLTPRETEVCSLLAQGRNLPVIMSELQISQGTAHAHKTHVYRKLGIHSQQELISLVESEGAKLRVDS